MQDEVLEKPLVGVPFASLIGAEEWARRMWRDMLHLASSQGATSLKLVATRELDEEHEGDGDVNLTPEDIDCPGDFELTLCIEGVELSEEFLSDLAQKHRADVQAAWEADDPASVDVDPLAAALFGSFAVNVFSGDLQFFFFSTGGEEASRDEDLGEKFSGGAVVSMFFSPLLGTPDATPRVVLKALADVMHHSNLLHQGVDVCYDGDTTLFSAPEVVDMMMPAFSRETKIDEVGLILVDDDHDPVVVAGLDDVFDGAPRGSGYIHYRCAGVYFFSEQVTGQERDVIVDVVATYESEVFEPNRRALRQEFHERWHPTYQNSFGDLIRKPQ